MARLANESLTHPSVVDTAAWIVARVPPELRAAALRDWLSRAVWFVPDPIGPEVVRTPRRMVRTVSLNGYAYGDCDDVATLGAALGKAVGMPARFKAVGFGPTLPFSHVYTELLTPQGWLELDTTRPHQVTAAQAHPARVMLLGV